MVFFTAFPAEACLTAALAGALGAAFFTVFLTETAFFVAFLPAEAARLTLHDMPRRPRMAPGGLAYHVLNCAVAHLPLFEKEGDYAAFERVPSRNRRPGELNRS